MPDIPLTAEEAIAGVSLTQMTYRGIEIIQLVLYGLGGLRCEIFSWNIESLRENIQYQSREEDISMYGNSQSAIHQDNL